MENIIGKTFNWLTIIEEVKKTQNDTKKYYKCKCICGNEKIVRLDNLKNGNTKSCGCLKKLNGYTKNIKNSIFNKYIGQTFGRLTVLKILPQKINQSYLLECQCSCGTVIQIPSYRLGKTLSCGCLKSKGEEKISQLLCENNIAFEKEKTFKTCINPITKHLLRFDFFVNNQYLIEYDGIQHCRNDIQIGWQDSFEDIHARDIIKTQWCKENNIPLIRIPYTKIDTLTIQDLMYPFSK